MSKTPRLEIEYNKRISKGDRNLMSRRRPHPSRPWSAEEVARLRRLAGRETTAQGIAEQLGRTERAARSKAYKEGISLRGATDHHAATETRSASIHARAREYVAEKIVAGMTAYARANTGQAMFLAAASGVVLGFALGGKKRRGRMMAGPEEGSFAAVVSTERAIDDWEGEGGSVITKG